MKQLVGRHYPEIEKFYGDLSENQLFTIVGHELTHHLDLFIDDREDGIWFEEGMCDYLSGNFMLSETEITNIELALVAMFKDKYAIIL